MGKLAFVFPGQGAQSVGMGKDVFDAVPEARLVFETADRVLGFPLSELIFHGPEEELKRTFNAQPALLTTSVALLSALRVRTDVRPDYVAGHSLGEYTALVAAGALSFEDAVRLVRIRGECMEEAVPAGRGGMAAVLGADREALVRLCERISAEIGPIEPANVNAPGQIVVSGVAAAVKAVVERAAEAGARRAVLLEVSGPFHSSLMKPAAERFGAYVAQTTFRPPVVPVVSNVTAESATEPETIRNLLVRQVTAPVLWEDSVRWLVGQGVDRFVEIGPGQVLSGLIRRIAPAVHVISVDGLPALSKVSDQLVESG